MPARKGLLAAAVMCLGAGAHTEASAQQLNVAIFGGSFADNVRACVAEPFEKQSGARVNFVLGNSVQNAARLRATRGRPDVDIAYMDLKVVVQAKAEGVKTVRIHALLDGRDVPETSALDYVVPFEAFLAELSGDGFDARIASGV